MPVRPPDLSEVRPPVRPLSQRSTRDARGDDGKALLDFRWFGAAGDEPVEILSVLGRQGERIHVRAAPRRKAESS
jgi:hypothetical protein